jgi:hypothetical protein
MEHEIYDPVEAGKINRLYYSGQNWYDRHCHVSLEHLRPGFIRITTREREHIYALFRAINRHGVEL